MTTRLTWMQEKKLQNCLGGKQFSLLFKASVHDSDPEDLLHICCNQGPTITVIYSDDRVIAAYMSQGYNKEKESIIFFTFEGTKILKCEMQPGFQWEKSDFWHGQYNYGNSDFQIDLKERKVTMSLNIIEKLTLPQCQTISFQECEVFRCEGKFI